MKDIPSVKVGAQRFAVVLWDGKEAGLIAECEGATNVELMEIRISDSYPTRRRAETLIHEVLHAILWDAGLDWNDENAELWIRRVSPRLAALLADNPKEMHALIDMFQDA